jgi:hypothetical protein
VDQLARSQDIPTKVSLMFRKGAKIAHEHAAAALQNDTTRERADSPARSCGPINNASGETR